jgi:hypothetical protein
MRSLSFLSLLLAFPKLLFLTGIVSGVALSGFVDLRQSNRGMIARAVANPSPVSQAPSPILPLTQNPVGSTQAGMQIVVNGRAIAVPWLQWPATSGNWRTGISEAGLQRVMGFQLMNTENPAQQPIQWFSSTASLPTRLSSTVRYLDITDLAQQAGWEVQSTAGSLQIAHLRPESWAFGRRNNLGAIAG